MSNGSQHKEKISVAIAGLGFGESVHLPALEANKSIFEPISLWHPRAERLKEACQANNLQGHASWPELLNDPQIDAVIIATPPAARTPAW